MKHLRVPLEDPSSTQARRQLYPRYQSSGEGDNPHPHCHIPLVAAYVHPCLPPKRPPHPPFHMKQQLRLVPDWPKRLSLLDRYHEA